MADNMYLTAKSADVTVSRAKGRPMPGRVAQTAAAITLAALSGAMQPATAQTPPPASAPAIHFIWMGSHDCPPCIVWQRNELPKLQASPDFKAIRFSYVEKDIRSPVPPKALLPAEVQPFKALLDEASGGRSGSPQGALIVNGVMHDYFFGTRTAEQIEEMIQSVRNGKPAEYPFYRCLKVAPRGRDCDKPA